MHAPVELFGKKRAKIAGKSTREEAIEPELVAAVTNMDKHSILHPTLVTPGEELPEGFIRSCSGFLVDKNLQMVKVNQAIVKRDTDHLERHAITVYFVGGKQTPQVIQQWLATLQNEVGAWIGVGRDLGRGFFYIHTKSLPVIQKLLMLTPHQS